MELIIIWLILCICVGVYANGKGRSGIGFFFLSFFLSPLIGLIIALVSYPNEEKIEEKTISTGERKKCPFCAELVKTEAKVCKHCQRDLPEIELPVMIIDNIKYPVMSIKNEDLEYIKKTNKCHLCSNELEKMENVKNKLSSSYIPGSNTIVRKEVEEFLVCRSCGRSFRINE